MVVVWLVLILVHKPGKILGSGENPNFFFSGANKKKLDLFPMSIFLGGQHCN